MIMEEEAEEHAQQTFLPSTTGMYDNNIVDSWARDNIKIQRYVTRPDQYPLQL